MTTLFALYMGGTEAGTDPWVIFTSLFSVVFLLLVPMNYSFREHIMKRVVNLEKIEVYSKIADELKAKIKNRSDIEPAILDREIEKIVSELIGAVNAFLYGYCEGSIIHSYNVKEGLDRIFYDWMKIDRKLTFLMVEKEALDDWRQDIAHSNVSKPLTSASKRRDKKRKREKKLKNRYIRNVKTDYEKALNSIAFVMQEISYIKRFELDSADVNLRSDV